MKAILDRCQFLSDHGLQHSVNNSPFDQMLKLSHIGDAHDLTTMLEVAPESTVHFSGQWQDH
jgi:hypothetical protein